MSPICASLTAVLALRLGGAHGIEESRAKRMLEAFAQVVEASRPGVRVDGAAPGCEPASDCARQTARDSSADCVVVLSLIGGVTRTKVVAELFEAGGAAVSREQIELGADLSSPTVDRALEGLAPRLLGQAPAAFTPARSREVTPPAEDSGLNLVPIVGFSASVLALGAGTVLALGALPTREGARVQFVSAEVDEETRAREGRRGMALGLLGGALGLAALTVLIELGSR